MDKYMKYAFDYWAFGGGPFRSVIERLDAWNRRHGHKLRIDSSEEISKSLKNMEKLFSEEFVFPIPESYPETVYWGAHIGTFAEVEQKLIETQGEHIAKASISLLRERMEDVKLNLIIDMIDKHMLEQDVKAKSECSGSTDMDSGSGEHCPDADRP